MTARRFWIALGALAVTASAAYALTTPSASDGPVRLLACVVTANGTLEASVESQTDDRMSCDIRCGYELGDKMFTHYFTETIPGRFQGRVGQFDTNGAKAGNYSGEISRCEKVSRSAATGSRRPSGSADRAPS